MCGSAVLSVALSVSPTATDTSGGDASSQQHHVCAREYVDLCGAKTESSYSVYITARWKVTVIEYDHPTAVEHAFSE